jgi:transcriptional regulator with XRE-family HTH domain
MATINGAWFRNKLTQKSKSQRSMAKHLKLDPGAVTLMLNGKRRMQMDEAQQIAVFLSEPLADVLRAAGLPINSGGNESPNRKPMPADPVQALIQRRDELLAEVETLNKALEVMQK